MGLTTSQFPVLQNSLAHTVCAIPVSGASSTCPSLTLHTCLLGAAPRITFLSGTLIGSSIRISKRHGIASSRNTQQEIGCTVLPGVVENGSSRITYPLKMGARLENASAAVRESVVSVITKCTYQENVPKTQPLSSLSKLQRKRAGRDAIVALLWLN